MKTTRENAISECQQSNMVFIDLIQKLCLGRENSNFHPSKVINGHDMPKDRQEHCFWPIGSKEKQSSVLAVNIGVHKFSDTQKK